MTKENIKIKKWPVIGHDKNITSLQNNIKNDFVGHAYLFVGPESVGKNTVASSFAGTLLCEGNEKPCGVCDICNRIKKDSFSDYIQINQDRKKIKIEQVRDLQHKMSLKSLGKYKVCIINGIDNFTIEAANAMLKLLEEPKGKVVFILIADSLENVLPTIISRCTLYRFSIVSEERIIDWLSQKDKKSDNLQDIVRMSSGRPGYAYNLLYDPDIIAEKNETEEDIKNIIDSNLSKAFAVISEWVHHEDVKLDKLEILQQWMRDMYLYKIGGQDILISSGNIEKYYQNYSQKFTLQNINKILNTIIKSKEMIRLNVNRKLVLENIALSIKNA